MASEPINYFRDEAPGDSLQENVENEKLKLLRLVAEHGTTGQRIYDEAARRTRASSTEGAKAATTKSTAVPISVISEVARDMDRTVQVFDDILEESARAAEEDTVRRQSIEAIYKDAVAGDLSLEKAAQDQIDAYNMSLRKGGRGRGFGRPRGSVPSAGPTVAASFLEHTPEAVPGFDQDYYDRTGVAAPPPSLEAAARAVAEQAGDPYLGRTGQYGPGGNQLAPAPYQDPAKRATSGPRKGGGGGGSSLRR